MNDRGCRHNRRVIRPMRKWEVSASVAALLITWVGFWWFQKTRKGVADVL